MNRETPSPKTSRQRIQDQVLGSILFLLVGVVSIVGIWAYLQSRRMLAKELGRRLEQGAGLLATRAPAHLIPVVQGKGPAAAKVREFLEEGRKACGADNALIVDSEGRVLVDAAGKFGFLEVNHYLAQDRYEMEEALRTGLPLADELYEGADGRFYMSAYARVGASEEGGKGNLLVVEASAGFLEEASRLGRRMFVVSLLFLGLAAGWSILFARSILGPIQRLVRAAESAAQGRLDTRLPEVPPNELGFLAKSFNTMIEQLKRHNDALLESLGGGLVAADIQGRVIAFNKGARTLASQDREDVLGLMVEEALRDLPEGAVLLRKSLAGEGPTTGREARAGGRVLLLSASPIPGPEGDRVGAELLILDQTELSSLRDEVTLKDRLAALGEMSAQVAHDLRNPMAALQGWIEMARRRHPEDGTGSPLDRAQVEIQVLNGIVSDFLDFARPGPPLREPGDLRATVEEALRSLESRAERAGVSFIVQGLSRLPAEFDPKKIRRALLNVLTNAIEATPRGGAVKVRLEQKAGGKSEIVIEDQGRGIAPEAKERLFQPFVTTKPEGTGLGLAIVQKIVQAHGGKAWGDNLPGGGASFGISLP